MPLSSIFVTNSRGLIWKSRDGTCGSFRNQEQKQFAMVGEPNFDHKDLVTLVEHLQPTCVVGAVGVCPNCFSKQMVEALLKAPRPPRPRRSYKRPLFLVVSGGHGAPRDLRAQQP